MPNLLWHEPAKYQRAKYRQREKLNPMGSLGFAGFVFVAALLLRYFSGINAQPGTHPPEWLPSVAVALLTAVFAAYLLPRFIGLFDNSIVILSEKGLNNNSVWGGVTIRFWSWDKIGYAYFWTETLEGIEYPVISFCDSDSIVLATLCRSEKIAQQEIEAALNPYSIPYQFEAIQ